VKGCQIRSGELILVLLREGGAIEMIHEYLHQRRAMQIGKPGDFSNDPHMPETLYRLAIFAILVANQNYAMHGKLGRM
jgi:hypothetical protein